MKKIFMFLAFSLVLADLAAYYVWKNYKPARSPAIVRPMPSPASPPTPQQPTQGMAAPAGSVPSTSTATSVAGPASGASAMATFCRTPAECVKYCSDPSHAAQCEEFVTGKPPQKAAPPTPPPTVTHPTQRAPKLEEALRGAPPFFWECLRGKIDDQTIERLKTGSAELDPDGGAIVENCFRAARGENGAVQQPQTQP